MGTPIRTILDDLDKSELENQINAKAESDHTHSAYVNQNAFSNVTVGSTTIAADSATDTLTVVAGSNVTLTPDATNDKITIAATDTIYTHPTYTAKSSGLYKVTVDGTGHVSGATAVAKSDITALGIPAQDTTYSAATTSVAGLMSAADKTKLNGVYEEVSKKTITNNLNDEVYEYGYLNSSGQETALSPITWSFRTANYIPVEGGKTITWNADRSNSEMQNNIRRVVEYDEGKNFVKYTDSLQITLNKWDKSKGLTLQANTKYVRFTVYKSTSNEIDLSAVKLNLFYVENIAEFWTGAGDTFNHVPHFKIESAGEFVPLAKIQSPLTGKKIIYDGDSIAESRLSYAVNGGGYAKLIADAVGGTYQNFAVGGARLTTKPSDKTYHSVVDNVVDLPDDGDLYCFEGGINDYWTPKTLGTFSKTDFTGALDKNTICGALETIFRYALSNFVGKPICFVITHKIQSTAYAKNANNDTFEDYRNAMVGICQKYSIPYYDAFSESGLNGWNTEQNNAYLTSNTDGTADGTHPNEEGYKRYYVPQLISLFERIMPR